MKNDFSIFEQRVVSSCAMHTHDFLELAYIKQGWAIHQAGDVCRRIQAGDFVLLDFGQSHGYTAASDDLQVVNCLFQPSLVDASLCKCRSFSELLTGCMIGLGGFGVTKAYTAKILHDDSGEIAHTLEMLIKESGLQQPGCHTVIRALVTVLVVQIARKAGYQAEWEAGIEVQWLLEEVRRSADRPHKLSEYAQQFQMRPEQLGKKFFRQTGELFSHYVRRRRIETACRLLLETELSVSNIAEKCGYEDEKSFRAAFKTVTGTTPRAYRQQNEKNMRSNTYTALAE